MPARAGMVPAAWGQSGIFRLPALQLPNGGGTLWHEFDVSANRLTGALPPFLSVSAVPEVARGGIYIAVMGACLASPGVAVRVWSLCTEHPQDCLPCRVDAHVLCTASQGSMRAACTSDGWSLAYCRATASPRPARRPFTTSQTPAGSPRRRRRPPSNQALRQGRPCWARSPPWCEQSTSECHSGRQRERQLPCAWKGPGSMLLCCAGQGASIDRHRPPTPAFRCAAMLLTAAAACRAECVGRRAAAAAAAARRARGRGHWHPGGAAGGRDCHRGPLGILLQAWHR